MDSHQWTLVLFLLFFLLYAIAESASQLLNKHKLQVILDAKREKSSLNRLLLAENAGTLRSNLQFGKLFFLIWSVIFFFIGGGSDVVNIVTMISVLIFSALYIPILLAFRSPKLIISALLPVIKFLNVVIVPLDKPRNMLFLYVRALARKQTNGTEDHDEQQQLEAYLGEAEEEGLFEPDEVEMVRQVVEFGDTVVKEVMTPRVSIESVSRTMNLQEFSHFASNIKYSRYPVISEKIDNVVGIAHIKELLGLPGDKLSSTSVEGIASEPYFVPESKKVSSLLRDFQDHKQQMAIVVDEYGGTAGVITLEDILEEIVGEIEDEHDKEETSDIEETADGSLIVSGSVDVTEIEKIMDVDLDDEAYETISGLALNHLKHIPEKGEEFITEGGIKVEILDASERSINKLKLTKMENDE